MSEDFYHKDIFGNTIDLDLEEEVEEVKLTKPAPELDFNIFAFTDAVGARNKKDAWVLYQRALGQGQVPEQLFYKVFWLVRTMLLAERCATAGEAGLNPFVYQKSKSFLKNFKPGEVEKLSERLVCMYHDARRGLVDFEFGLEKIILSL